MLVIGVGVYAGFPFLVREVVMEDEATPVAAPAAPAESDALEEEREDRAFDSRPRRDARRRAFRRS